MKEDCSYTREVLLSAVCENVSYFLLIHVPNSTRDWPLCTILQLLALFIYWSELGGFKCLH